MKLSKKIFSTFAMSAMAASGLLSSCSVDDFIAHKDDIIKKLGDFKFSTSNEVVLDIDYGPLASQALVQVYSENPLANATEEDQTPEGELVFSAFLDKNGIYCGTVDIPAHANHLYFYTSSMAAPMLMDAEMKDGRVTVANNMTSPRSTRADATTRAVNDNELEVRKLNSNENGGTAQNFYTIFGGWDNYGRVNDINGLVDEGTLTADDVQSIEHYFWYIGENETKWTKPGNPTGDRLKRLRDLRVDDVNMVVQEKYEENGQTYDVKSAEVWFTFLTEYAWNQNTVGYYFFNKNNPPKSPADIDKKFIILPHASKPNEAPFGAKGNELYHNEYAPTHTNQRVQLLYVDENGKASKNFPPNIEIGFFLIADGFKCDNPNVGTETIDGITYNTRVNRKINTSKRETYYSNYEFNGGSVDGTGGNIKKRFVACRLANGTVVYGCEDGSNESYDDMMFTITATPEKALHTQEGSILQSIPHKQVPRTYTDQSENYTYAFEDLWPDGGDYDLNDVVVRLSRTIKKDQFNDVSKVVDNYTINVGKTTGNIDAFAVQVPTAHKGDRMTLPTDAWYEEETGTFFLTRDVHLVDNQTLTITREFDHPVTFKEIQNELNPFIVNQTKGVDCKQSGRIEIHMPLGEVTSKGKKIDNAKNPAKAWYISDDGQAPYAIKIPGTTFEPCEETVRIGSKDGAYPNFNKWVKSLGKEYKEWYKNK